MVSVERKVGAVYGAGHRIDYATRVTGHAWPAVDPIELVSTITHTADGTVYPAKPLRKYAPSLWQRVCAAWLVLTGHAAAVRWLSHD